MGSEALQLHWPKILSELQQEIFFQTRGCVVVHHPQDHGEWDHFIYRISSKLDCVDMKLLDEANLAEIEPGLSQFSRAYFFPQEGQIDAQNVVAALADELLNCGGSLEFNADIIGFESFQIKTTLTTRVFDWVFDCRGLLAKDIFTDLRGLRGELIWLHAPEVKLQRPVRFLHPRYSIYIAPRPEQIFLLGASELEAEDFSNISLRTMLELLSAAYCLNPGFAEARVLKTVTQCRPALPNNLPSIKTQKGLTAINGLYRHGFLVAPTLAEEVVRGTYAEQRHYPELWDDYDYHLYQ